MRKYIKSSVDTSTAIHVDGGWIDNIEFCESLDSEFIVSVCFDESIGYMEADSMPEQYKADCLQFGMVIMDDDIVIPKGLEFGVRFNFNHTGYFTISRDGTDINWYYFEGYPCCIKFTEFGYKCYLASESLGKSFDEVVKTILTYREYFDIK